MLRWCVVSSRPLLTSWTTSLSPPHSLPPCLQGPWLPIAHSWSQSRLVVTVSQHVVCQSVLGYDTVTRASGPRARPPASAPSIRDIIVLRRFGSAGSHEVANSSVVLAAPPAGRNMKPFHLGDNHVGRELEWQQTAFTLPRLCMKILNTIIANLANLLRDLKPANAILLLFKSLWFNLSDAGFHCAVLFPLYVFVFVFVQLGYGGVVDLLCVCPRPSY